MNGALVLVVDDDPDLRELLELVLTDAGFRVACAEDGREALRAVGREMPRVILLDMKMPVMDGWQFARGFREHYEGRASIVVLTAAADVRRCTEEVRAELGLGKPFRIDEVLSAVRRCVGEARGPFQ